MLSYGVEWDITVADPTCTRIGNPLFHKSLPIQSEYKGCVVKNGKLQYYLNPNDWSKKSNGEPSHLDGTDGDVMIRTPRFYGKSGSNGNKRWVRISTVKEEETIYNFIQVQLTGVPNYKDCIKNIIREYVSQTEEFDLINSYNKLQITGEKNSEDMRKYTDYISLLDKIKTNVKRDFNILARS